MRAKNLDELKQQEEIDTLQDLVEAKLKTVWLEIEWQKRLASLPIEKRDQLTMWWLFSFVAEQAVTTFGATEESFVAGMREAFRAVELEEEEDEEGEPAIMAAPVVPAPIAPVVPEAVPTAPALPES